MYLSRRAFFTGLIACPICASAATPEWNYTTEGPQKWPSLAPEFQVCGTGDQESPIDLRGGIDAKLPPIQTNWKKAQQTILNNGHTIQVVVAAGNTTTIGGVIWPMTQFHFHLPSEHAVDGKRTAMELHYVHQQPDGKIAVLAVIITAGARNEQFAAIMAAAPQTTDKRVPSPSPIDPAALLPANRTSTWRYEGSLTTPPCSQNVDWIIFTQNITADAADIERFRKLFPMDARPLQPLNRRYILRG